MVKKECGIFDYDSRLYICLKAKDCQPANRRGRRMGVTLCVCVKTRQLVWVIAYQNIIYAEYTCLCVSARMFVCMISGCQLQFCGPEENTAASLRVLLVPLSYRCAGLRLCQFLCVCLRVRVCMHTILLQETKVIPQGFLLGWDLDT